MAPTVKVSVALMIPETWGYSIYLSYTPIEEHSLRLGGYLELDCI